MPILTGEITEHGPVVEVLVGVPEGKRAALQRNNMRIPERRRVRCLLDTGSSITGFTADVLRPLDLTSLGRIKVFTPSTGQVPHECNEHAVSVSLEHTADGIEMYIGVVAVIESEMWQGEGAQGLIGRDILDHCLFVYDGPQKRFSLGF